MKIPSRSVDTPVANSPREATASDPPKSTIKARRQLCQVVLSPRHTHAGNGTSMKDVQTILIDGQIKAKLLLG